MTNQSIKIFTGISIVVFLIFNFLEFELFDSLSYAVSVAAILNWAYDRWLWRINPLEKSPKIYGTYNATNSSNYNGGIQYNSTVEIKQTRSSITVCEKMRDGICESVTASLSKNVSNGNWFLYYTYLTHPKTLNNDDMHYGTSILCIHDRNLIKGNYYTNQIKQTCGTQKLVRRK